MALLFLDGFDHYGNGVGLVATGKWGEHAGSTNHTSTNGRFRTGGYSATAYYGWTEANTHFLPANGGFVAGVAINISAGPAAGAGNDWLRIKENTTSHLMLAMIAGGFLVVKNGAGTVLATGLQAIPINAWSYVEFKGIIDDVAGSFEVRIDGVSQAELTMSGIDTRNGGTGQWNRASITVPVEGWSSWFDDFYLCDMSGTIRNNFLGAIKIETIMVQTDAVAIGSNQGLTPSTGTDHGALVDEIPANATDYNSGATVGLKDTYNLAPLIGSGAVLGVQINLFAAKSDAGVRKVCAVWRAGGTDYDGPDKTLLTTFQYRTDIKQINPATGLEWTTVEVNALEAGMKVTV